jgi:hypothetical protein
VPRRIAELHAFEVFFDDSRVAGREVVEVASAQDLFTVRVDYSDLALDDIAPMWGGAAIVR